MIGLPEGPQQQQNAPNPFNSETVISWFLLRPDPTKVEVFSLTGQRVALLHQGRKKAESIGPAGTVATTGAAPWPAASTCTGW